MVYLFVGQDSPTKEAALRRLKEESLSRGLEQFNFDLLYAEGLFLKELQEKLLNLPVHSAKRVLFIKNSEALKKEIENFILEWAKKERKDTILVLDIGPDAKKEHFIRSISKYAKVTRFKEVLPPNTFALSRQIDERRPDNALKILSQLINDGERPERILGGLRYSIEHSMKGTVGLRRRMKLLLNCDIEIKTGRLRPVFALEKLVVNLCALS